jgi:hypothetical protein
MAARKAAFSAAVSERALNRSGRSFGFFAQPGDEAPAGEQRPPVGQVRARLARRRGDHRQHRLGRRDVVARRERLEPGDGEDFLEVARALDEGEAAAHGQPRGIPAR